MAAAGLLHGDVVSDADADVDADPDADPDAYADVDPAAAAAAAAGIRPDRWLEMEAQPSPYSYLAFNAGKPQSC